MIKNVHGNTVDYLGEAIVAGRFGSGGSLPAEPLLCEELGVSRTVANGRKTQFEFLRIELVDDVPTYVAQPQGRAGTAFRRSASGDDWIRFENLTHDFPQRIEYRRSGDTLQAEIAGPGEDGKTMSIPFEFTRCTQ